MINRPEQRPPPSNLTRELASESVRLVVAAGRRRRRSSDSPLRMARLTREVRPRLSRDHERSGQCQTRLLESSLVFSRDLTLRTPGTCVTCALHENQGKQRSMDFGARRSGFRLSDRETTYTLYTFRVKRSAPCTAQYLMDGFYGGKSERLRESTAPCFATYLRLSGVVSLLDEDVGGRMA